MVVLNRVILAFQVFFGWDFIGYVSSTPEMAPAFTMTRLTLRLDLDKEERKNRICQEISSDATRAGDRSVRARHWRATHWIEVPSTPAEEETATNDNGVFVEGEFVGKMYRVESELQLKRMRLLVDE